MKKKLMMVVLIAALLALSSVGHASALSESEQERVYSLFDENGSSAAAQQQPQPLMVPLTLISSAASTGAVCLDGTLPGYHLHPGSGSGANSWLIQLEGGGWCNTIRSCVYRKTTRRGSSKFMEKQLPFTGLLSNKPEENPDFYNWNRVKLRYCDGASFSGDSQNEASQLYFRGQRIWLAAIQELLSKGMKTAQQTLLSGCSAGGLASILHCDEFRSFFPETTKVKCLSDAGLFLDATDVSGGHTLRNFYKGVVSLQEVQKKLSGSCTNHLDPTSCFFPQNLIANIKTPLFLLNAAYDAWQLQASLAPPSADPHGSWNECKLNHARCNASQIQFLQDFRNQMIDAIKGFSLSSQNGLFINSCFAHCQSERQDTWFANDSPVLESKAIAISVGDWYFDREKIKAIDCAYPCDNTCHNLVFNNEDSSSPNTMVYESKSTRLTTFTLQNLSTLASMTPLICFHCIILLCGWGFRMSKPMLLSYGLGLILFSYYFEQSSA